MPYASHPPPCTFTEEAPDTFRFTDRAGSRGSLLGHHEYELFSNVLVRSPLQSYSSVGLARRRNLSLFGPVVTVKTHEPFGRVVMAFTVGDFLETLATDGATNGLFHAKHPTWSLKVGLVRFQY
jgi:hypothetical protein